MTAKERVVVEMGELEARINKLYDFMTNSAFSKLSKESQFLLEMQADAMTMYLDILRRRLEIWQD